MFYGLVLWLLHVLFLFVIAPLYVFDRRYSHLVMVLSSCVCTASKGLTSPGRVAAVAAAVKCGREGQCSWRRTSDSKDGTEQRRRRRPSDS